MRIMIPKHIGDKALTANGHPKVRKTEAFPVKIWGHKGRKKIELKYFLARQSLKMRSSFRDQIFSMISIILPCPFLKSETAVYSYLVAIKWPN